MKTRKDMEKSMTTSAEWDAKNVSFIPRRPRINFVYAEAENYLVPNLSRLCVTFVKEIIDKIINNK